MWVGNLMLVVLNLPLIGIWVKLLHGAVPAAVSGDPAVLLHRRLHASTTASFDVLHDRALRLRSATSSSSSSASRRRCCSGFVLGPMMEENLRRAMLLSRGDPTVFVTRPIVGGAARLAVRCSLVIVLPLDPQEARGGFSGEPSARSSDNTCGMPNEHAALERRRRRSRNRSTGPCPTRRAGSRCSRATSSRPRSRSPRRRASRCSRRAATRSMRRSPTAITLTVVEPCSNGLGSDLFAILWDGSELHRPERLGPRAGGVDRRRASPAQQPMPRARLGHGDRFPARCPAGSRCRSASASCRSPTCSSRRSDYARDGYAVSPIVAEKWALAVPLMPQATSAWPSTSCRDGRAPRPGERFASRARWRERCEKIAATRGRSVLSRRARRSDGRACAGPRRRAYARRLRAAHAPTG